MTEERLKNIQEMEEILNKTEVFTSEAKQFLEKWENLLPEIKKLSDYYYEGGWKDDYDASNRGEIPEGIPHGVLSEDAIYNATGEHYLTAVEFLKTVTKIIANE